MRKPIIFLDIDGVLNSVQYAIRKRNAQLARGEKLTAGIMGIDDQAVKNLSYILESVDCDMVLSSTWRIIYSLDEVNEMLLKAGLRKGRLIDKTPRMLSCIRGVEVQNWLYVNGMIDQHDAPPFVCIDDDKDFLDWQPLVHTDNYYGLTRADADKAIALLKKVVVV